MPKDKLLHLAIGLLAALVTLIVWVLLAQGGLAPLSGLPAALAISTTWVGLTKEGADYMDNRVQPGMHGVDPLDALATAAPGWVAGLVAAQVLQTLELTA